MQSKEVLRELVNANEVLLELVSANEVLLELVIASNQESEYTLPLFVKTFYPNFGI